MRVVLNGEPQTLRDGLTVADLVADLGLSQRRIAVELNQTIVGRETYTTRAIAENDEIEIVQFVGGG